MKRRLKSPQKANPRGCFAAVMNVPMCRSVTYTQIIKEKTDVQHERLRGWSEVK